MKKQELTGWMENNILLYILDGWKPRKTAKVFFLFKNKQEDGKDGWFHTKVRITIEEI